MRTAVDNAYDIMMDDPLLNDPENKRNLIVNMAFVTIALRDLQERGRNGEISSWQMLRESPCINKKDIRYDDGELVLKCDQFKAVAEDFTEYCASCLEQVIYTRNEVVEMIKDFIRERD
jgi:hypothetical protein